MQTPVVETAEVRAIEVAAAAHEVTQAVSVAAAYFEDTLQTVAGQCAGRRGRWARRRWRR